MRLIDADALKKYILINNVGCGCSEDYQKSFLSAVEDQPTAVPDTVKDLVTIFQNSKDMKLIARDGDLRADRIVVGRVPFEVRTVVTGKWIKLDMHRGMEQYKCSACNSECYIPECMGEPLYEFCPNCGARMEEKE